MVSKLETGAAPICGAVNMNGQATDVMRRQHNAMCLRVIDNPFGGG